MKKLISIRTGSSYGSVHGGLRRRFLYSRFHRRFFRGCFHCCFRRGDLR